MVYNSVNGLAPVYMSEMFKYAACSDLSLQSGKHKDIYINSFVYSGTKIWNDIPTHIRNYVSLESFKGAYLRTYFK